MLKQMLRKAGFTDKEISYIATTVTVLSCGLYLYDNRKVGRDIIKKTTKLQGGNNARKTTSSKTKSVGSYQKNRGRS